VDEEECHNHQEKPLVEMFVTTPPKQGELA